MAGRDRLVVQSDCGSRHRQSLHCEGWEVKIHTLKKCEVVKDCTVICVFLLIHNAFKQMCIDSALSACNDSG